MGDPYGIGPEVIVRAASSRESGIRLVVYANPVVLSRTSRRAGVALPRSLEIVFSGLEVPERPLGPCADGGRAAFECLEAAVSAVLGGECEALVTAPLSKEAIALAGHPFPGHTEYLEARTGAKAVMMLAGRGLRVALATTHVRIADLPRRIRKAPLLETLRILDGDLRRRFGIARPRIAVCGLNPHAGEGGRFGDEERREIAPAVRAAARLGIRATGPFAADGLFPRALRGDFDAILAMYHDQGLAALKAVAFDEGVNVTLGLPIVRTSPDHGTAFDIAGKGIARASSMIEAIRMAADLARRFRRRLRR